MLHSTAARRAQSRVFVVGGHITPFVGKGSPAFIDKKHPDFGTKKNPTLSAILSDTVKGTLGSCGMEANQLAAMIDKVTVGNFAGELFANQGHLGPAGIGGLTYGSPGASNPLAGKSAIRVEGACSSGGLAVLTAADALRAGSAQLAMAVGVEVQNTVAPRVGGDYLARAADYDRQRGIDDFTFPCLFARRMKHIVEAGLFTMEDTARVAAKAYENARKNPLAQMYTQTWDFARCSTDSKENPLFLGNPEYKPYLRVTDCSQVSDGGCGVVLASEEGLAKLGLSPSDSRLVELKSIVCTTASLFEDPEDPTRMPHSRAAAQQALAFAGVTPKDLGVAEVHDCFAVTELLMYEALGLAEYGQAKDLVRNGETALDGRIPVNTGGGLLGFGHPTGATGVKQVMEIYRQMKGGCGDYQLKKVPAVGATLNMGGDDRTAVSMVLKNI